MHQIDVSTASPALPASTSAGNPGYFTDGDVVRGAPPTVVPAEFLNAVMLEMLNVVTGAGITPSKAVNNQLLLAVKQLISAAATSSVTVNASGGTVVLTPAQAACAFIGIAGALTANVTIVFPAVLQRWTILNGTTGPFTVTCKTAAGVGVTVSQGRVDTIICEGRSVLFENFDAPLQPYGDSSSAVASTLYVDRAVSQVGGYYQDIGSALNAYVVALTPPVTTADHPVSFRFRTTRPNTGTSTMNFGAGTYALATEQGNNLKAGDISTGSIVSVTFDPALGLVTINELVPSQLGALAKENVGDGLEDDGAGNLRIKVADVSFRRSAAGIQAANPITYVPTSTSFSAGSNRQIIFATGSAVTLTAPPRSTLWNGFQVSIVASAGPVAFAPDPADSVNGAPIGQAYTIQQGQSVTMANDGGGTWYPLFQTTVPGAFSAKYINSSQAVGAGTYNVDTAAGPITVTLPSGAIAGTCLEFTDISGTWGTNAFTLARNGNTIFGSATDLNCDVSGETFKIWFNGSDWRLY